MGINSGNIKNTLAFACLFFIVLFSNLSYSVETISMVSLISHPEQYKGRTIIVPGYLSLAYEGTALFLHKDDYEYSLTENGVWLEIEFAQYAKHNNKYVYIEGTFDIKNKGHMGIYLGTINHIKRVWTQSKVRK